MKNTYNIYNTAFPTILIVLQYRLLLSQTAEGSCPRKAGAQKGLDTQPCSLLVSVLHPLAIAFKHGHHSDPEDVSCLSTAVLLIGGTRPHLAFLSVLALAGHLLSVPAPLLRLARFRLIRPARFLLHRRLIAESLPRQARSGPRYDFPSFPAPPGREVKLILRWRHHNLS